MSKSKDVQSNEGVWRLIVIAIFDELSNQLFITEDDGESEILLSALVPQVNL